MIRSNYYTYLFLILLLIPIVEANEFEISTTLDVTGIVDDESDDIQKYTYDHVYFPDWEDIDRITDKTRTSGGDLSVNKNYRRFNIEKVMSYNPSESGHLSTISRGYEKMDFPWRRSEYTVEGIGEFHGPAAIESKLYGGSPFFRYTVGPNLNTSFPNALGSVQTRYAERTDFYNYSYEWNSTEGWYGYSNRSPEYEKKISDKTMVSGNIHKLSKSYTAEYYWEPGWYGFIF